MAGRGDCPVHLLALVPRLVAEHLGTRHKGVLGDVCVLELLLL